MLDDIYKDVWENFDSISEQIRTLDIYAPASLSAFQSFSEIEDLNEVGEAKAMLYELLLDSEKVIDTLNVANSLAEGHIGLQNFLQGLSEKIEKWQWFLRATVKGK